MSRRTALLALALAVCAPVACAPGATGGREISVFAAASLTEAFGRIAAAYERRHASTGVRLVFGATPGLAAQIAEGAPADVFASADLRHVRRLEAAGLLERPATTFAVNRLTIVVEPGNPHRIRSLADLARPDLVVSLCARAVPAGAYSARSLARAGADVDADALEPDVKAVVTRVALGEADAGIAYVTDAIAARGDVDAVPIPARHNVVARYPAAVVAGEDGAGAARAFVSFLRSRLARAILQRHGFGSP